MKFRYENGRLYLPSGKPSPNLVCCECGKMLAHAYETIDGKIVCFACHDKDEKGGLE